MGHIAILSHTFFPVVGGAEVGIHELARRLATRHSVTVVTPMPEAEGGVRDTLAPDGYRVLRYPGRFWATTRLGWLRLRLSWQEFLVLRALHRREPLAAVNVHFAGWYGLVAIWVRLFLRVPVTLSLVGRTDVYRDLSRSSRFHLWLCLRAASAVTQISRYCLEGCSDASRVPVLPYGVDTKLYRGRSDGVHEPVRLIAVQRLSRVKRVDALIDVLQDLARDETARYQLTVVGTGPEAEDLRSHASTSVIDIRFSGFVPSHELPRLLEESDIFVTHTMSETFGVMFAEAMAAGLPIVAVDTTSVPYVVVDGRNGVLVPPFDVDAFSAAVRSVSRNLATHSRMSVTNRQDAIEMYDWDRIAELFERLVPLRGR